MHLFGTNIPVWPRSVLVNIGLIRALKEEATLQRSWHSASTFYKGGGRNQCNFMCYIEYHDLAWDGTAHKEQQKIERVGGCCREPVA